MNKVHNTNGNYLVTIIIPVYNVEERIDYCLESVLAQTYQNIEILLIDDGSTDNSGKICDRYSQRDSRITVIHKKNGGVSTARNVGIVQSNGDYICFVDSDDAVKPDMIKKCCIMRLNMMPIYLVVCWKLSRLMDRFGLL